MINQRSATRDQALTSDPLSGSARITAPIGRAWRSTLARIDRIAIRGQLGPSVGHPNDRRPEPPF